MTTTEPVILAAGSAGRLTDRVWRLLVGLALFGTSLAMLVSAQLGVAAWDVFHQGVAARTGLSFGTVVVMVSVAVVALWFPLRQRPGPGTLANIVVVGVVADVALAVMPAPEAWQARGLLLAGGIGLNGVATALYIGAGLGPGPRDGLMTGLATRGLSIVRARTAIELSVLAAGWAMGGTVGLGTVAYALAIGPIIQVVLPMVTVPEGARGE